MPRGTLDKSWNLIVRACAPCNGTKSDLEDDISAITMQGDGFGRLVRQDQRLAAATGRKAVKSFSRRTGRRVVDSHESIHLSHETGAGIRMTFSLVAPPQAAPARVAALADLQLRALFYWLTYNQPTRVGGFWPGRFYLVNSASRSDWGNQQQRWFARLCAGFELRLVAVAADGYFKVSIRRQIPSLCWGWALEWNDNLRSVGFFGDEAAVEAVATAMPLQPATAHPQGDGSVLRIRREVPLEPSEDTLFS